MSLASLVGLLDGGAFMRVVFSDESGTSGKDALTVVAAVMLNLDCQYDALINDVNQFLIAAFNNAGKATEYEIKGDRLTDDLHSNREKAKYAKQLVPSLLSLSVKYQFPIFYGAVDNNRFKISEQYYKDLREPLGKVLRKSPRVAISFAECLRRVNTYAATAYPSERFAWIHDQGGQMNAASHSEVAFFRNQEAVRTHLVGTEKQELSYGAGRAGITLPIPSIRLVENVFFGDSASSRLLQLADLCSSTITAYLLSAYKYINRTDKKASLASFYHLIKPQVVNDDTPPVFCQL